MRSVNRREPQLNLLFGIHSSGKLASDGHDEDVCDPDEGQEKLGFAFAYVIVDCKIR